MDAGDDPHRGVRSITAVGGVLWLFAVACGFVIGGLDLAAGISLGGALALVNFWLLGRSVNRLVATAGREDVAGSAWTVVRWAVIGVSLMVALWALQVNPAGLLVGLTVVVTAIPVSAALGLLRG